jgi:Restriction endonuclease
MPRRTNLFQEVVGIVHEHMAEDATVEHSAMLTNRATGEAREVDVVIRTRAAAHELIISVEASSSSRRATVEWVEQMIGKHANLPTNKLVLVAKAGFTAQAREAAEAANIVALAPVDIGKDDPSHDVVNRLKSIWPKSITLSPKTVRIHLRRSEGGESVQRWFSSMPDHLIFLDDGSDFVTTSDFASSVMRLGMPTFQTSLESMSDTQMQQFFIRVGPPIRVRLESGAEHGIAAKFEEVDPPEYHEIEAIEVMGDALIEIEELELTHRRLGDVVYAVGETSINQRPAIVLATEGEGGDMVTIRFRDR